MFFNMFKLRGVLTLKTFLALTKSLNIIKMCFFYIKEKLWETDHIKLNNNLKLGSLSSTHLFCGLSTGLKSVTVHLSEVSQRRWALENHSLWQTYTFRAPLKQRPAEMIWGQSICSSYSSVLPYLSLLCLPYNLNLISCHFLTVKLVLFRSLFILLSKISA